jgi:hypothetical protein
MEKPRDRSLEIEDLIDMDIEGRDPSALREIQKQIESLLSDASAHQASQLNDKSELIDELIAEQEKEAESSPEKEELPENVKEVKSALDAAKEKRRKNRSEKERITAEIEDMVSKGVPVDAQEIKQQIGLLRSQLKWKEIRKIGDLEERVKAQIAVLEEALREFEKVAPIEQEKVEDSTRTEWQLSEVLPRAQAIIDSPLKGKTETELRDLLNEALRFWINTYVTDSREMGEVSVELNRKIEKIKEELKQFPSEIEGEAEDQVSSNLGGSGAQAVPFSAEEEESEFFSPETRTAQFEKLLDTINYGLDSFASDFPPTVSRCAEDVRYLNRQLSSLEIEIPWGLEDRVEATRTRINELLVRVQDRMAELQARSSGADTPESEPDAPVSFVTGDIELTDSGDPEDLDDDEAEAITEKSVPPEATLEERNQFRRALDKGWGAMQQMARGAGTSVKEIFTTKEGFYRFLSGAGAGGAVRIGAKLIFDANGGVLISAGAGAMGGIARKAVEARGKRKNYEKGQRDISESPADFIELVKKNKLHKLDALQLLAERNKEIEKMTAESDHAEALKLNAEFDNEKILKSIFNNLEEIENLNGIDKFNKYLELADEAESDELKVRSKDLEKELAFLTGRKISKGELARAAFQGAVGGVVGNLIGGFLVEHLHINKIPLPKWFGGGSQVETPVGSSSAGAPDVGSTAPPVREDLIPRTPQGGAVPRVDSVGVRADSLSVPKASIDPLSSTPADVNTPVAPEVPQTKTIDMSRFKIGLTGHEVETLEPKLHELTLTEARAPQVMSQIDKSMSVGQLLNKLADANVEPGPDLEAAYVLHDLGPTAEDLDKSVSEYLYERLSPDRVATTHLESVPGVELQGTETLEVSSQEPEPRVLEQHDPAAPPVTSSVSEPVHLSKDTVITPKSAPIDSNFALEDSVEVDSLPKTQAEKSFFNWTLAGKMAGGAAIATGLGGAALYGAKRLDRAVVEKSKKQEINEVIKETSAERVKNAETPEAIKALTPEEKRTKIMSLLPPRGGRFFGRNREVWEVNSLLETRKPRDLFNALYKVAEKNPAKIEDVRKAGEVALALYPGALAEFHKLNDSLNTYKQQKIAENLRKTP